MRTYRRRRMCCYALGRTDTRLDRDSPCSKHSSRAKLQTVMVFIALLLLLLCAFRIQRVTSITYSRQRGLYELVPQTSRRPAAIFASTRT